MVGIKRWGVLAIVMAFGLSAQVPEDPVMKARTQRPEGQGAEGDLPPVPRTVLEPPPLPPPEEHQRDSKKARKGKAAKSTPAKGKAKGKATPKSSKPKKKPKG